MTKPSIVIVEDEHIVAMDLRDLLEELGYRVLAVVDNGAAALAQIAEMPPDLVLLDIYLRGDIDGIRCLPLYTATLMSRSAISSAR